MKRLMRAALLAMIMALILPVQTVFAETMTGADNWSVSFTQDKKMVSNFKPSDFEDVIYGMQPGDTAKISVKVANNNSATTDWYMSNKVLYSLEDRSNDNNTAGGAYTYRLTYKGSSGKETVLYDSDVVGGDEVSPAGEGLREATDALEDYFYLDTLAKGKGGTINLTVGLEGETQGNDYQDTLADLQMNFAVELPDKAATETKASTTTTEKKTSTKSSTSTVVRTTRTVVKTGDDNNLLPYYIAAAVSGALMLALGIYGVKKRREDKEGGAA